MKKLHLLLLAILAFIACNSINAQERTLNDSEKYLLKYSAIAVEQMEKYGIPASITLAQGLLESGAGKSKLATEANNHFGIKADSRWSGETCSSFDNGNWHKFRVYKNAEKSYEDHSLFLTGNQRYSALFKLKRADYKGWAKGLKDAYYAEDREYDKKLIGIIERYGLYRYDTQTAGTKSWEKESGTPKEILKANGMLYVIADSGDTFKSLSKELGLSKRKIRKYNDLNGDYTFKSGDIVYLEKKHNKAAKGYDFHTTKKGESLYKISQIYGIKLKALYKMNPQYVSYTTLKVGDVVRLR
ncbi:MAG: glucosaminidase domain-containing protein [Bacteroidaceae bacterium]|nr:glucosaminidase domain-containing protein [Bacteroidaceae bacterium]